jgi:hypothetical protein
MGTYVAEEDVLSRLPEDFDISPAAEIITRRITAREAIVEVKLAHRYAIPITGTRSVEVVKSICTDLVAGDVLLTLRQEEVAREFSERYARGVLIDPAEALLNSLVSGEVLLDDATTSTEDAAMVGYDGYDDLTDEEKGDLEPAFKREQLWDTF